MSKRGQDFFGPDDSVDYLPSECRGTDRTFRSFAAAARTAAATVVILLLPACGSLYLHNNERETELTDAKAAFDAAGPGPLFESHRTFLNSLAEEEIDAVGANLRALRDLNLALYIEEGEATKPNGKPRDPAWVRMARGINTRAKELYGPNWAKFAKDFEDLPRLSSNRRRELGVWRGHVNNARADFLVLFDSPPEGLKLCVPMDKPKISDNPYKENSSDDQEAFKWIKYENLLESCKGLKEELDSKSGIKIAGIFENADSSRDLQQTNSKLEKLKSESEDQLSKSVELKKKLKDAEKEYKVAVKKAAGNQDDPQVKQARKVLESRFKLLKTLTEGETSSEAAERFSQIADIFERALLAEAGALPQDSQNSSSADSPAGATEGDDLQSLRAVSDVFLEFRGNLAAARNSGRVHALLVGLAYYRYKANLAKAQADRLQGKIDILKERRGAILAELASLSVAHRAALQITQSQPACTRGVRGFARLLSACRDQSPDMISAASQALAAYGQAWSGGRYRHQLSYYDEIALDRKYALLSSELGATLTHSALRPLMNQLAEYGKGGIKVETIIETLKTIGIFSIVGRQ